MKIKYYGTAAAEGFPGIFCNCDACKRARAAGGRNIRTRSQALVDDKILIDFPPDTYFHVLNYGLDLTKITSCIITHSHPDHLYATDLEMRKYGYAYIDENGAPPLMLYASNASGKIIEKAIVEHELAKTDTVHLKIIKAFSPFKVEGYTITAYKADHAKHLDPVFYSISDNEKTLLYANDTGYFPEATWEYLEKTKPYFNFVSLDCTGITLDYKTNHMGINANVEVKEKLIEIGCADDKTVFCMHHFSHNGKLTYDELVPIAKEKGFIVSYDNMEVSF